MVTHSGGVKGKLLMVLTHGDELHSDGAGDLMEMIIMMMLVMFMLKRLMTGAAGGSGVTGHVG